MEALYRYANGLLTALAALFAPMTPLIWSVVAFIGVDFLSGVVASRADSRREGEEWYFESREAWRTVTKLGFSVISLMMAYLIDTLMLDFLHLNLTKLFAGFVCGVEMWSFVENACRISDSRLLRHIRQLVRQKVKQQIEK
ncbi:MAG: phage holin family protein [Alistipes sp.]|nr:phage holin family protein [Alistipes sp.]